MSYPGYPQNQDQIVWNPYTQRYEYVPRNNGQNNGQGWNTMPPAQPAPQQAPAPQDGLPTINRVMWGQGMEAAKSVPLAPNENVMILDSESARFYIAKAGPDGKPRPLEAFRYEREKETASGGDFVTRKEFDELKASLASLTAPQQHEEKDGE